jgi:hypothetical protein
LPSPRWSAKPPVCHKAAIAERQEFSALLKILRAALTVIRKFEKCVLCAAMARKCLCQGICGNLRCVPKRIFWPAVQRNCIDIVAVAKDYDTPRIRHQLFQQFEPTRL